MISRRSVLMTLLVAAVSSGVRPLWAASGGRNAVKMFDTDNDGSLDLAEVKKAADAAGFKYVFSGCSPRGLAV